MINAISYNNDSVVKLLINYGAPINDQESTKKLTPLMVAVQKSKKETIKTLIKNGAKVNAFDFKGRTPLMHAILNDNPTAVSILIKKGAKINVKDNRGRTPLIIASSENPNSNIISILIENEVDFKVKDDTGKTAFDYIVDNEQLADKEVYKVLRNKTYDARLDVAGVKLKYQDAFRDSFWKIQNSYDKLLDDNPALKDPLVIYTPRNNTLLLRYKDYIPPPDDLSYYSYDYRIVSLKVYTCNLYPYIDRVAYSLWRDYGMNFNPKVEIVYPFANGGIMIINLRGNYANLKFSLPNSEKMYYINNVRRVISTMTGIHLANVALKNKPAYKALLQLYGVEPKK